MSKKYKIVVERDVIVVLVLYKSHERLFQEVNIDLRAWIAARGNQITIIKPIQFKEFLIIFSCGSLYLVIRIL